MAKILITAHEVREARKEGRTEIVAPPGAIITPQARDDAGEFGIRLIGETSRPVAPPHVAESVPAVLPKPVVAGGGVPGRITLYAGKAFDEATAGGQPTPGAESPGFACKGL